MEFIQNYVPTSKEQLLQVALWLNKGDVQKAQEMVDYYVKNIELPDHEPVKPTWQQSTKETINGALGWIKENQDTLMQGWDFIRTYVLKRGTPAPPVNPSSAPLPPINS